MIMSRVKLTCFDPLCLLSGPNKSLKHKSSFSLKRGAVGGAEEGGMWGGGVPSPLRVGSGEGLCPLPRKFLDFLS